MPRIASPIAILLSLLMAATSASAAVCDVSCWLHTANSDCHPTASASHISIEVRSTSSVADKASNHCGHRTRVQGNSMHGNSVASANGMPAVEARHSEQPPQDANFAPDSSGRMSSCAQQSCDGPSVSSLKTDGIISQIVPLYAATMRTISFFSSCANPPAAGLKSPPLSILAADPLLGTLRI